MLRSGPVVLRKLGRLPLVARLTQTLNSYMKTRAALLLLIVLVLAGGCGPKAETGATGSTPSPSVAASPLASPSASPAPAQSPPPVAPVQGPVLVIRDDDLNTNPEVRLARLDATDTARVPGSLMQIVSNRAIIVNGNTLEALASNGAVTKMGTIDGQAVGGWPPRIVVKPDLSQWVYTRVTSNITSEIHLASANSNRVIATVPTPDNNNFFVPFAWNDSGVYVIRAASGLGGWGPFLHYLFPIYRLNLQTGAMTQIQPQCRAWGVLNNGTLLCDQAQTSPAGESLEIRAPDGSTKTVSLGSAYQSYFRVMVSPDQSKVVLARNAASGSTITYQLAVVSLANATWKQFGSLDYWPNAWLPDGRIVADHTCVGEYSTDYSSGSCNSSLDATYIFSADGSSKSYFYKMRPNAYVVGYLT